MGNSLIARWIRWRIARPQVGNYWMQHLWMREQFQKDLWKWKRRNPLRDRRK